MNSPSKEISHLVRIYNIKYDSNIKHKKHLPNFYLCRKETSRVGEDYGKIPRAHPCYHWKILNWAKVTRTRSVEVRSIINACVGTLSPSISLFSNSCRWSGNVWFSKKIRHSPYFSQITNYNRMRSWWVRYTRSARTRTASYTASTPATRSTAPPVNDSL